MLKKITTLLTLSTLLFSLFGLFSTVSAATTTPAAPDNKVKIIQLQNPIGGTAEKPEGTTDIREIYGLAIKSVMGILGSVALIAFVYGGVLWLTSGGAMDRVKKGLNSMLYAAVGLFVIFATYGILTTLIEGLTK